MLSINGAIRNNWFSDSSNSAHPISNIGLVTQSFEGGGVVAARFTTAGQRLLVTDSGNEFNFATGAFTFEAFIYQIAYDTSIVNAGSIFGTLRDSQTGYVFTPGESVIRMRITSDANGGAWGDNVVASNGATINTWLHFAAVRSGGNLKIYRNGVAVGTLTTVGSYNFRNNPSKTAIIGWWNEGAGQQYYSNFKIAGLRVTNTAVYTANFTPPTTLPTAISGTKLLLNFGGTVAPTV
jgi:hypothetical protein